MIRDISRAAVLGLGRSGRSAAHVLMAYGVQVTAFDQNAPDAAGIDLVANWDGALPMDRFDLIVSSPGIPKTHPALLAACKESIPIWSEPELAFRIARAPIWAVTGTNGKSTTTAMLHSIALAAGLEAHLCGNIAGEGLDNPITAAAMQADDLDVLIAEISSFQLEWVDQFRPRLAILTNIASDHLTRYEGRDDYFRTKERIFNNMTSKDVAIVGEPSAKTGAAQRIDFGVETKGDCAFWRNGQMVLRRGGIEWELGGEGDIQVPGEFNRQNALAAAAGAFAMGVPSKDIRNGLRVFKGLPHRMQIIADVDGVRYIDNSSCTNPDSVFKTIVGVDFPIVALIGGHDKELDLSPIVEAAKRLAKPTVIYGAIADRLSKALNNLPHKKAKNLEEALGIAAAMAEPGESIVLLPGCSSFDAYKDFAERAAHFRQLVDEHLGARV